MSKNRRKLELLYDNLYSNPKQYDVCEYCGIDTDLTIDHVPSLDALNGCSLSFFESKNIPVMKVTACAQCNSALTNLAIFTFEQRKDYIAKFLSKKYKKVLNAPKWTKEELAEVSPSLQKLILQTQQESSLAKKRLEWALGG